MNRITEIVLEDRDGQWRHRVDWVALMRPARFEHAGRTFDQSRVLDDGTWVYKTADKPKRRCVRMAPVRLERGAARCFVTEFDVLHPAPDTLEYQDATYVRKGMSDGRVLYWHG